MQVAAQLGLVHGQQGRPGGGSRPVVEDVERQIVAECTHQDVASSEAILAPYVELSAGVYKLNLVALQGDDTNILKMLKDD